MASLRAGQTLTAKLLNDVIPAKEDVPTNEDLIFNWSLQQSTAIANTRDDMIAVAPYDMTILSVNLVWDNADIPADDVNYWQISVQKISTDGTFTTMAVRTTQATGADANGGITHEVDWNFDGATWATRTVFRGEILRFLITEVAGTATPPTMATPIYATIRYQRQAAA